MEKKEYPVLEFAGIKEWEEFLAKEFDNAPGVWLKFAKKGSGETTITYDEVLDFKLLRSLKHAREECKLS